MDEGAPDGIVVVDKPAGITSHDVVARVRRLAGIRRVGHAGTLDPMATGVVVVGVGRGTRLLTYLSGLDKDYEATIRLGIATVTDDADGEVTAVAPLGAVAHMDAARLERAVSALTGEIHQVPSAVSAIKVAGRRAYALVRAGEKVALAPRPVEVSLFAVDSLRRGTAVVPNPDGSPPASGATVDDGVAADVLDIDVRVTVSAGTYVRALARDLGVALGVGGHLTALRRTRVGPFTLTEARTLDQLAASWAMMPLAQAAARRFAALALTSAEARALGLGQTIEARGPRAQDCAPGGDGIDRGLHGDGGPMAALGPDGTLVALVAADQAETRLRPVVVFAPHTG
jgi:tRNA pseudouridine55 synthase